MKIMFNFHWWIYVRTGNCFFTPFIHISITFKDKWSPGEYIAIPPKVIHNALIIDSLHNTFFICFWQIWIYILVQVVKLYGKIVWKNSLFRFCSQLYWNIMFCMFLHFLGGYATSRRRGEGYFSVYMTQTHSRAKTGRN